jgi:DNA-binding XRE family transcriptional regulator
MIRNERQYNVTKGQIRRLKDAIKAAESMRADVDPEIRDAMIAGYESQLEELRAELAAFDELRKATSLEVHSMEELPDALIKARVARGLTQEELAERVGVKPQQIQRYEATGYRTASMKRVLEIANAMTVKIDATIEFGKPGL